MGLLRRKVEANAPLPFDASMLPRDLDLPAVRYAPQEVVPEAPEMISPEELAKITSETIKAAHEETAKSLDALCEQITLRVNEIEQMKAQALEQIREIKELAEQHRDAGRIMALKVESATLEMSDVRGIVDGLRKKIAADQ